MHRSGLWEPHRDALKALNWAASMPELILNWTDWKLSGLRRKDCLKQYLGYMARKLFLSNNPQVIIYTLTVIFDKVSYKTALGQSIIINQSITNNTAALSQSILGLLALYTHLSSDLGTLQTLLFERTGFTILKLLDEWKDKMWRENKKVTCNTKGRQTDQRAVCAHQLLGHGHKARKINFLCYLTKIYQAA